MYHKIIFTAKKKKSFFFLTNICKHKREVSKKANQSINKARSEGEF